MTTLVGGADQAFTEPFLFTVKGFASTLEAAGWVTTFVPFAGEWTQTKYPFEPYQNQIFRVISVDGGLSGMIISGGPEEVLLDGDWTIRDFPFPFSDDGTNPHYWDDIRKFYVAIINELGGIDGKWKIENEQLIQETSYANFYIMEYNDGSNDLNEVPDVSNFQMGQALRQLFGGPQRGGYIAVTNADGLGQVANRITLWLQYPIAPIVFNSFPAWFATSEGLSRDHHPGWFKPDNSCAYLRLPGMAPTQIYANPYFVSAQALAQSADGSTNSLLAGVLRPFGDTTRAGFASAVGSLRTSKSVFLHAMILNDAFFNQNRALTFDILYPRMFRLNTEVDEKRWPDESIQCSECPVVHRADVFPDYFIAGYLPHILIGHSNYADGSIILFDNRRYAAWGNGPNTLLCELPFPPEPES